MLQPLVLLFLNFFLRLGVKPEVGLNKRGFDIDGRYREYGSNGSWTLLTKKPKGKGTKRLTGKRIKALLPFLTPEGSIPSDHETRAYVSLLLLGCKVNPYTVLPLGEEQRITKVLGVFRAREIVELLGYTVYLGNEDFKGRRLGLYWRLKRAMDATVEGFEEQVKAYLAKQETKNKKKVK